MALTVYLETGKKKIFACVVDWPGWARAGRTEEAALEALAEYRQRFQVVTDEAGLRLPKPVFEVVERVPGNATTDFGAPGLPAKLDFAPVGKAEATRQAKVLRAAWTVFDRVAAKTPEQLRKGPRGGGRDRDKMIDHVLGAEAGYARQIGIKHKQPALGDTAAIEALRADILTVVGKPNDGSPPRENGWPTRYATRRLAWHVLDHLWEMEDRSEFP